MSSIVDPRRRAALPPMNARFLDSSEDEEEEDEETRLEREEEEQERLLSKQFGEAAEAPSSNKRKQEEDIEAEYGAAGRKKARKRPTLQPAMLTGSKGLIRIRSEFPRTLCWNSSQKNKSKLNAAAQYSHSLIHAYKSFCYDLFPNSAFEDVVTRIETFGSKKEVKDYMQHMRNDVRNTHLEGIYGKSKAESMISELEHGLQQQQAHGDEFGDDDEMLMMEDGQSRDYELRRGPVRGPPPTMEEENSGNGAGQEEEAPTASAVSTRSNTGTGTAAATSTSNVTTTAATAKEDDLQDTDDELEFVVSSKPNPVNPFADDDSDDDDDEVANETKMSAEASSKANTDKEASKTNIDDKDAEEDGTGGASAAAVDKTITKDAEMMEDDDDETVVMEALQSKVQAKLQEQIKEFKSPEETTTFVATTESQVEGNANIITKTQETGDEIMDDPAEEEESNMDVPPQETQAETQSSDETATIVPTMSESQFDDIATQGETEDSQFVATEPPQEAIADSTLEEEVPTQQVESPPREKDVKADTS